MSEKNPADSIASDSAHTEEETQDADQLVNEAEQNTTLETVLAADSAIYRSAPERKPTENLALLERLHTAAREGSENSIRNARAAKISKGQPDEATMNAHWTQHTNLKQIAAKLEHTIERMKYDQFASTKDIAKAGGHRATSLYSD